ncbi:MAG TPA: alcohol dehydrogenase catalytic domain-containing protein [Candidatus Dormibacteraeota bacterium]
MQAVVKSSAGPGASWTMVEEGEPGPDQVQLQLVAAGICGTDLHILAWNPWAAARVHPPRVLGHEMAGLVLARGEAVESPEVGDLVGVESHLVDLSCRQCQRGDYHVCENTRILGVDVDGVFAERVIVPARNCRVAPPSLDPALVCFQEPMGNAVHAAAQGELRDQVVIVTGCGPIGCAAVGIAKAEGARLVVAVDRVRRRLEIAEQMGADALVDTAATGELGPALRQACRGEADVVLEMSGHPLLIQGALGAIRPGGWISLLGLGDGQLSLDLSAQVVMRGVTLFGVTGRRQFETWDQTQAYLTSGRVDVSPIITHRVPLAEFPRAAALAESAEVGKVVLYPPEGG